MPVKYLLFVPYLKPAELSIATKTNTFCCNTKNYLLFDVQYLRKIRKKGLLPKVRWLEGLIIERLLFHIQQKAVVTTSVHLTGI